jgi:hypothetical protein
VVLVGAQPGGEGRGSERGSETVALRVCQQGCLRALSQRHAELAIFRPKPLVVTGDDVGGQRHAEAFEDEIKVLENEQLLRNLRARNEEGARGVCVCVCVCV